MSKKSDLRKQRDGTIINHRSKKDEGKLGSSLEIVRQRLESEFKLVKSTLPTVAPLMSLLASSVLTTATTEPLITVSTRTVGTNLAPLVAPLNNR